MHVRLAMPASNVLPMASLLGLSLLLSGCVGTARTFYSAGPAVPARSAASRLLSRPASPAAAPALSASEKQRLFQEFQRSQGAKDEADTQEPAP